MSESGSFIVDVDLQFVPLELIFYNKYPGSSTHLPPSDGWTAELADGLQFMIPKVCGFEPTKASLQGSEIQHLYHKATG